MKKITKGFTLIELLIVIALLGALAVALLAALDPLEQIKKGTDTGIRNTVAEISGSIIRYASVKSGSMPYAGSIAWAEVGTVTSGSIYTAIQNVIDTGELKQDFFALSKDQLGKIFITADQTRTYVCFEPGAKSFKADANTKFVPTATSGVMEEASCLNGTVATAGSMGMSSVGAACYWCVR